MVSELQLSEALRRQTTDPGRLGEILVGMQVLSESGVLQALAGQLELPFRTDLDATALDLSLLRRVPQAFSARAKVLPLGLTGGSAQVAMSDPLDTSALDRLRMFLGVSMTVVLAPSAVIREAMHQGYDRVRREDEALPEFAAPTEEPYFEDGELLDGEEAPIIRAVSTLFHQAVRERASDIHIEPMDGCVIVRYRLDGVLRVVAQLPKGTQRPMANRIKILGGLNIAETRKSQDGRIRIRVAGRAVDIRLSTVPTGHGERLVLRLLDQDAVLLDLKQLGLDDEQRVDFESLIQRSNGIVLVTGPTGSGKSTSLYAGLSRINRPSVNILTVEDPVEYQLFGVGQVPVDLKAGTTFASSLRSFLRQDPDVIMVGEIRDHETAEIATQASLTGHMVLSTMHTNDAPGAVTRLMELGVEPFLVASSLVGVLAQRLVRQVCAQCAVPVAATEADFLALEIPVPQPPRDWPTLRQAKGCDACKGTGYRGRTAIYELMLVDDAIRSLILDKKDSRSIKQAALARGMKTLLAHGAEKVLAGITTTDEVLRVTQGEV
jgi:general secretion pathway protein E